MAHLMSSIGNFVSSWRSPSSRADMTLSCCVVGLAATFAWYCNKEKLVNVPIGYFGVVMHLLGNVRNKALRPGNHRIMYMERVYLFNIEPIMHIYEWTIKMKDLRRITMHVEIVFKPNVADLPLLFKSAASNMPIETRIVPNVALQIAEDFWKQYNSRELISRRGELNEEFCNQISSEFQSYHLIVGAFVRDHNVVRVLQQEGAMDVVELRELEMIHQTFTVPKRNREEKPGEIEIAQDDATAE